MHHVKVISILLLKNMPYQRLYILMFFVTMHQYLLKLSTKIEAIPEVVLPEVSKLIGAVMRNNKEDHNKENINNKKENVFTTVTQQYCTN